MQIKYKLTALACPLLAACASSSTSNNISDMSLSENSALFHQCFVGQNDNN